ncbi:MAG: S-methyl-5-thioribose-1-phosphate isomerase [Phycisphaerae bacterium]|nr:S-methyl-5-thioribose-1-phosphate isomerase [Phycisphaerae bacterium]
MARRSLSLAFDGSALWLLDQTRLPDVEEWVEASGAESAAAHIRALKVRGAPLIGVAAGLSLACVARSGAPRAAFEAGAATLRAARPTAVNLMGAVDRVIGAAARAGDAWREEAVREAVVLFDEDVALCDRIAAHGAALISDGEGVLTHCNTGGLATAGVGTAFGALRRAWEGGTRLHVYAGETRPLLQGARLTAWELARLGVPHTLVTDSMAGALMGAGKVHRVLVGADRVARNGDFANKIGTYAVAVLAHHHRIPFHVVAPSTSFDPTCASGAGIPIEERDPAEVRGASGAFGRVRWAPEGTPTWNPAFDVTPAELVTSWITERGVLGRGDLGGG